VGRWDGHFDLALQLAGGIVTAQPFQPSQRALHTNPGCSTARPSGGTRLVVAEQQQTGGGSLSRRSPRQVIGIDHAARRIGIVHRPVVQAPPDAVRTRRRRFLAYLNGKVGDRGGTRRSFGARRDRPGPKKKTTLAINDAVVERAVRFASFRVGDELGRLGLRIPEGQSHRASPMTRPRPTARKAHHAHRQAHTKAFHAGPRREK